MVIVVRLFQCHPEISGGQHGKNERLEECHQQFERHHEQRKRNSREQASDGATCAGATFAKYKNQADKTQDHDVACGDVGKKTQQEGEGTQEQPENFHRSQDEDFEQWRYARHPKRVFPEMFVAARQHQHKGDERQYDGHRNITRHVRTAGEERDLSDQVKAEDKKEYRQQVRHVLFVFRTDGRARHVVSDKSVERFDEVLQAFGSQSFASLGRGGCHAEQEKQEHRSQEHREHVAGNGVVVETGDAAAHNTAVEGGFGIEFLAFAFDQGGINDFRFAVFFDVFVRITLNGVLSGRKSGIFDPHHIAMNQYETVFADFAAAVVVRVKSSSGCNGPALVGDIEKAGKMQVDVAENMNGIRIGDVVNGGFTGVEFAFFYLVDRVTAVAMRLGMGSWSGCVLRMIGLVRLIVLFGCLLRLIPVVVLCKGRKAQPAENQSNPVFANGCHIHFWKGFFQIGCKSTTRFWLKKTKKIIFPKKIGRAGHLHGGFGI